MNIEVEQKFPVPDGRDAEQKLVELGAVFGEIVEQVDAYFAHRRDFAQTDEALRLRRSGSQTFITYKGPKLDKTTKTRREIELPLSPGERTLEAFADLLLALGFSPVAKVRKLRRKAKLNWKDQAVEVCIDQVERLGSFVEIEVVTTADSLDAARESVISLASAIGLTGSQRRSYLELLLEKLDAAPDTGQSPC